MPRDVKANKDYTYSADHCGSFSSRRQHLWPSDTNCGRPWGQGHRGLHTRSCCHWKLIATKYETQATESFADPRSASLYPPSSYDSISVWKFKWQGLQNYFVWRVMTCCLLLFKNWRRSAYINCFYRIQLSNIWFIYIILVIKQNTRKNYLCYLVPWNKLLCARERVRGKTVG